MHLDDLVARFDDETNALEAFLGLDDLSLLVQVKSTAEAGKIPVGAWTCKAVGHFVVPTMPNG